MTALPPTVLGRLDLPAGATVIGPGPLLVEGWAFDAERGVVAVDVWLAHAHLGGAPVDRRRNDVADHLGDARAARAGFQFVAVVPSDVTAGETTLRVEVRFDDGTVGGLAPVPVTVDPARTNDRWRPRVDGGVDRPEPGDRVGPGPLTVSGWAFDPDRGVSRVDVWLDRVHLGRAGIGRPRPDVAEVLGQPDAGLSGFELLVELPPVEEGGPATIRAELVLLDGTPAQLDPVEVVLAPPPPPPTAAAPPAPATPLRPSVRTAGAGPLRVLWCERSFGLGGSQLRLQEAVTALAARGGFESTVVAPGHGPLEAALGSAGATVHSLPDLPLDDVAAYERTVSELAGWAAGRFDLVVGWTLTSFPAVEAAARLGVPSVWRVGEAEPLPSVARWLGRELDPGVEARARTAARTTSLILCQTAAAAGVLARSGFTGRWGRFSTGTDLARARSFADARNRETCRRHLDLPLDRRLLLVPATVWQPKGQLNLVSALALAAEPSLTCVLVGQTHPEYVDRILDLVDRHGLQGSVLIPGFRHDLRPWYRAADVVACPSESESLPGAALEGMAFSLPVLGTRVGAVAELVEPGVNGWLCEPSDLLTLRDALVDIASASDDHLRALGAAGLCKAEADHDRVTAMPRLAELLGAVAAGSTPEWLDVRPL